MEGVQKKDQVLILRIRLQMKDPFSNIQYCKSILNYV